MPKVRLPLVPRTELRWEPLELLQVRGTLLYMAGMRALARDADWHQSTDRHLVVGFTPTINLRPELDEHVEGD